MAVAIVVAIVVLAVIDTTQHRCIMFLMIPTAFSNCGRLYLYALMLLLLLQGGC